MALKLEDILASKRARSLESQHEAVVDYGAGGVRESGSGRDARCRQPAQQAERDVGRQGTRDAYYRDAAPARGSRDSCDCVSGPRKVHRPVKPAGAAGTSGLADDFLRDHPLLNDGQHVVDEPVENESRREEEEEEREDEG